MDEHLHGVTTTHLLRASGLGKRAIATKVRRGELVRIRKSLYVHRAAPRTSRQIAATGVIANGQVAAVTGAEGARMHGWVVKERSDIVDLVVPEGYVVKPVPGTDFRHSSHLDVFRAHEIDGLPVAPIWWAVGDMGRDLTDRALAEVIAKACGARRTSLQMCTDAITYRVKFPGSARLRRTLANLSSDMPFSGTEARVVRRLRHAGYRVHLNHPIAVDGRVVVRDIVDLDARVNLEIDGPSHWMPDQAANDRKTDRGLRRDGWTVDRLSVYEIDADPELPVRVMARLLAARLSTRSGG